MVESNPKGDPKSILTPSSSAPQHEPRPLTLFLAMLLQQSDGDAAFVNAVLAGVRAYRDAERRPRPPAMPEVARVGRARVLDYGGEGRPVLFVPSLINPPYVLDLAEDNSLLRWLARQGVRPLLIDWGDPRAGDASLSIAGHVEALLIPLIETLGRDIVIAGYCLGGTLALAAAQLIPLQGLILIAAPWDFEGYPAVARAQMNDLWRQSAPGVEALGVFPMELLQSVFWNLDPQRTLRKYADFGTMTTDSPQARGFVALEDWANDGPPLTVAAARELLEDFQTDNITGRGGWTVGGVQIDPTRIACPALNVISTSDRIVPAASAASLDRRLLLTHGHVGMMVGSGARSGLWRALAQWLSQLRHS